MGKVAAGAGAESGVPTGGDGRGSCAERRSTSRLSRLYSSIDTEAFGAAEGSPVVQVVLVTWGRCLASAGADESRFTSKDNRRLVGVGVCVINCVPDAEGNWVVFPAWPFVLPPPLMHLLSLSLVQALSSSLSFLMSPGSDVRWWSACGAWYTVSVLRGGGGT